MLKICIIFCIEIHFVNFNLAPVSHLTSDVTGSSRITLRALKGHLLDKIRASLNRCLCKLDKLLKAYVKNPQINAYLIS